MYIHITFKERERIGILKAQGLSTPFIARRLGRDPTTVAGDAPVVAGLGQVSPSGWQNAARSG